MYKPRHLFAEWSHVRASARRACLLFLCLDFDGTLAPIRLRPESVGLAPGVRRLLRQIISEGAPVAIISGRSLTDVRRRAGLRGIWYAGVHGYFLLSPAGRRYSLLCAKQSARMQSVLRSLRARLRSIPGIQIEPKDATVAIHYRRAVPRHQRLARVVVQELSASSKDLKLMHGKKVWEILPATRIDKWTAVRFILHKQSYSRRKTLLLYLGDDTTDEAVFRKMKGISVAVGKRRGTAAHFFLRSPAEVKLFLKRWHELAS